MPGPGHDATASGQDAGLSVEQWARWSADTSPRRWAELGVPVVRLLQLHNEANMSGPPGPLVKLTHLLRRRNPDDVAWTTMSQILRGGSRAGGPGTESKFDPPAADHREIEMGMLDTISISENHYSALANELCVLGTDPGP